MIVESIPGFEKSTT